MCAAARRQQAAWRKPALRSLRWSASLRSDSVLMRGTRGADAAPAADPLPAMASAMRALAVKDADQQLADLLQTLAS